jgi:hypothetical protein
MQNKWKTVALSAFVLPGLGQLYAGRKVKGGLMIMLDNVFILAGLFIALRTVGKLMAAKGSQNVTPDQVLSSIRADNPFANWVLGAFLVLWVYGVVDAIVDKGGSNN